MKSLRGWGINLAVLLGACIVSLLCAEGLARVLYPVPSQADFRDYFCADQEMGFDIAPNRPSSWHHIYGYRYKIFSNELGCFDRPYRGERPYVLLVGDSFMWGYMDFDHKFGTCLERLLGMRVVQCGMPAIGTYQELVKARRVIRQIGAPPALIVVGYFSDNDSFDDLVFPGMVKIDGYWIDRVDHAAFRQGTPRYLSDEQLRQRIRVSTADPGLSKGVRAWLRRYSVFYTIGIKKTPVLAAARALGLAGTAPPDVAEAFRTPEEFPLAEQMWEKNKESVRGFAALAREQSCGILFVLIPDREMVSGATTLAGRDLSYPVRRIKSILDEEHIPYYDLLPSLQSYVRKAPWWRQSLFLSDDGHWNARGNRLAAALTAQALKEKGLLPKP